MTEEEARLRQLEFDLNEATDEAVMAVIQEVKLATHLLAVTARSEYPSAVRIQIHPVEGWMGQATLILTDGTEVDLVNDRGTLSHLYQDSLSAIPGVIGDPSGDVCEIDIDAAIREVEEL